MYVVFFLETYYSCSHDHKGTLMHRLSRLHAGISRRYVLLTMYPQLGTGRLIKCPSPVSMYGDKNSLNLVVMLLSINRKCCLLICRYDLRRPQFLLFHGKYRHFSRTRQIFRRFFLWFHSFFGLLRLIVVLKQPFPAVVPVLALFSLSPVLSVSRRSLVSRRRFSLQSVSSVFYNNKGTE